MNFHQRAETNRTLVQKLQTLASKDYFFLFFALEKPYGSSWRILHNLVLLVYIKIF